MTIDAPRTWYGRPVVVAFAAVSGVTVVLALVELAWVRLPSPWVHPFDIPFLVVGALVATACSVTATRAEGMARRFWALLAISTWLDVVADTAWLALDLLGDTPYVSWVDVVYILGYPALFAALWTIARSRNPLDGRACVVDGMAVAAGLSLLVWQVVVVAPGGMALADGPLERFVVASYPVLDLLVLGALLGLLLASPVGRGASMWALLAYVVVFLVSDITYSVVSWSAETLLPLAELGYLLAYVALGVAALAPSAAEIARRRPPRRSTAARFLLLGLAVTAPGLSATVAAGITGAADRAVLVVSTLVIAAVVSVRVAGSLAAERDARRRAEQAQRELAHLVLFDPLTQLPNRIALLDLLERVLPEGRVAVIFVDLDRFKAVNDTAGHSVGDEVLRLAAGRISAAVRTGDVVFRLAGDEFVVVCEDLASLDDATAVATRIVGAFQEPFVTGAMEWFVGGSVGIAVSEADDPVGAEELVQEADVAMYEAKKQEHGSVRLFDATMSRVLRERHDLETELRHALDEGRIRSSYQPIVSLEDGRVVGFEALARWWGQTLQPDAHFIQAAEHAGLVEEVDHHVTLEACRFVAAYNREHADDPPVWVAVNVSTRELAAGDLAGRIGAALEHSGIDPAWLVVELTEGALSVDPELAVRRLTTMHDLGVRLALDDFGTGFSSLAHLLRFPVDHLKVDRIFVEGLCDGDPRTSVAAAALQVATTLGIPAVAEGVETPEQAEALRQLGYGWGQGFLWSPAVPPEQALRLTSRMWSVAR